MPTGIDEEIPLKEYKRRKDLRDVRMVTIDGEDAKDLDDAVSIERLDNGRYRLGVHIADVSHYVREKNPLDKEALKRGTSVYLIERVIPMLPKKLSNGICSLNPKVDRLTLSCIMDIDSSGKVLEHEIVESVIRTNERMTYTDVTKILKDNDPELSKRYDYLLDDFKAMEELCNILYKKRTKRGAIDFEFEESKIILNEFGKPIDIKPYEREIANRIIEEFMLVCNETVAEHMFWSHLPFVYRIHEDPDEEKLEKFREFIYNLGYIVKWNGEVKPRNLQEILEKVRGKKEETVVSTLLLLEKFREFIYNLGYIVKWNGEVKPRNLQEILEKVRGKKEETVVSTLLLRSMMRAKYSPECVGHFGLAAKYYCHFTSPIRRYPDLQIHRIIKEFINGKIDDDRSKKLTALGDYAARQSSETENIATEAEREVDDLKKAEYMLDRIGEEFEENIATEAEREVDDLKKAEYMLDRIGEEFEGIVSSVTSFGMFVELPNTIEGLIHITALDDDYYIYDENHLCLMGERTKKIYRLGDFVKVRCSKVDIPNREIYFDMVEDEYIREEIKASKELAEKISEVKQELKEEDVEETDDNIL